MKLRRVKIEDIKVPEVRVTARMDEETSQQFQESVKAVGIDEPPKCYEVDGVLYLSDGLHRLNEAKKLGATYVEAYVRAGTMEDVLCNNLMSGHLRGTHPVSEMVRSIAYLWKTSGFDSIKIAEKTGLTRDYVEKLQRLSELTPLIQESIEEKWLGVGRAFCLTKIRDPILQESVFHQLKLGRWPVADVAKYVDDVLGLVNQRLEVSLTTAPAAPVKVRCFYCGAEGLPGVITNPNTCQACQLSMLQIIAQARAELEAEAAAKTKTQGA